MARTPVLLGPDGRPLQRRALTVPQARPSLGSIRQAWAPSVAMGLTPERLAGILLAASDGDTHDYVVLAEEMEERDAHYASVLGTRKRALSGIEPIVHPGGEDARSEEIADAVRDRIATADGLPGLVEDLMDAVGKGWSAVEIEWARSASQWWPERFTWADPRWFRWDRDTGRELRLLTDAEPAWGEPLAPGRWICFAARLKSGLPLRGGLARLVAFGWLCKSYAVKDWVSFAEIYGLPLRLGRYGPEATEADVRVLHQAVSSIGSDAAAVLPNSMQIEFEDLASKSDQGELFENLARWVDEQTSKAVLGQTMTSENGGSLAQARVHDGVRHDILRADARAVSAAINAQLVRPFVDLNFGVQPDYPRIEFPVSEPEDVPALTKGAEALVAMGVRLRAAELRQRLGGFSAPDPDDPADEIIGGPAPAPEPQPEPEDEPEDEAEPEDAPALNRAGGCACPSCRTATNREAADPYAELDVIAAEAALDWEPQLSPLVTPIRRLAEEVTSLEELRDRLPELAAGADLGPLVEAVTVALFKARVTGDLA
jgi:phage gp29-like protein